MAAAPVFPLPQPRPWRSVIISVLAVAALGGMAVPIAANHAQSENGRTVAFDHKTGNEWWVEATLSGADAATVTKVEAMDTNGPWTTLPKQSWGAYAASFHIEPGNQVRFRATWSDGDVVNSCWFTHPAGVEQACASSSTTTTTSSSSTSTTGGPGTFDATFTGVRGSEWWVQASVATNGPAISKVDVRLASNGVWGNYMPVTKQSWGWGSSYHIVQGTVVQLRATASDGQTDLSSCRQWLPPANQDAAIVTCPGSGNPPPNVWNMRVLQARDGSGPNDLAIGDADRDGRAETYVPHSDGLYRITSTGVTTVSTLDGWGHVAVGDADNDGLNELYATRVKDDYSGGELHRFVPSGTGWTDQLIYNDATHPLGPLTIGDVDVYGGRDIFIGRSDSGDAQVLQTSWSGPASQWLTQPIVNFGDDGSFLDVWTFWIANFDGDTNLELAVLTGGRGYSNAWIVDHGPPAPNVPSQWREHRLEAHAGYPTGLTAGDVDGDGKTELILGSDFDGLVLFRYSSTDPYTPAYTRQDVALGLSPSSLFFGDGDHDGDSEVYSTEYGATIRHAALRSGAWQVGIVGTLPGGDPVAGRIIVGDGDGNGRREVVVAMYDYDAEVGRVVQFAYGPANPQPAFDATFSGVSGNQWWVQVNVAANQPLLKVEARVNCGQIHKELTKQSWGGWAASFQIPDGARVTFRATSSDGSMDVSSGYIWPNATPAAGC